MIGQIGVCCVVLEQTGLSDKIVNIFKSMCAGTRVIYRLGNLVTCWVKTERGVWQGCI